FLITFGISFLVIVIAGLIINFSKRRQRKSPHGLTGMCHRTGGVVCGECGERMKKGADLNRDI
ncbi:MAG: hypothetical protein D3909_11155, partial [Candidatus Electrothrix sp. ATG1]|nr:hypothetical protein [Candidatus Electrothrix sp. ATG1]